MKLFMVLLGCKPKGRFTEQHDIFFGIANKMSELIPAIIAYWPEAKGKIHIDAWREVNVVGNFKISVVPKQDESVISVPGRNLLFFVNLGGYKAGEFDEFHYKTLVVAPDLKIAQRQAMATTFFKHTSLPTSDNHRKASAHIDDRYGIDVDDIYAVSDILAPDQKAKFGLQISSSTNDTSDVFNLGYFKLPDFDPINQPE